MKYLKELVLISISLILFASCDDDSDLNNGDDSSIVIIETGIDDVTTWYADSIYIVTEWIDISNSLVIEAGTIIKFETGAALYLATGGTILAQGTSENPIIFTSWRDDTHGGDTNEDGDLTSPDREDWDFVSTDGYNGSVFNFCEFYYGGGSGNYSYTLDISGKNNTVTNCTFAHNAGTTESGYERGALDAGGSDGDCTIGANLFYDNEVPLVINAAVSLSNSNQFHNPDSPEVKNDYNGIFVSYATSFDGNVSWGETEVAFVLYGQNIIEEGESLSLSNNTCLKFKPDSELWLGDEGVLVNYDGSMVAFTSYKDDTWKGDTNGDGDITSPSTGDWYGIYLNAPPYGWYHWPNIYFYETY